MSEETKPAGVSRRTFVKAASALGVSLGTSAPTLASAPEPAAPPGAMKPAAQATEEIVYPRQFTGRNLARISFPIGGIGTGSIGLGGRGNLQDFEIFNHPDTGRYPGNTFPAIWVKTGVQAPVVRILERRILPPFDLGVEMVTGVSMPGLPRLQEAVFTGSFPVAKIEFHDAKLPVNVQLEAFSSMRPVDHDACSIPAVILEYTVVNPAHESAEVVIAWSTANCVGNQDTRTNEIRQQPGMRALWMTDPKLAKDNPAFGSFVLAALAEEAATNAQARWDSDEWHTGGTRFWHDHFLPAGNLGNNEVKTPTSWTGSVSIRQTIPAGEKKTFRFVYAWHFPNRSSAGTGWSRGKENDLFFGNFYATHFKDAWEVATHAQEHLAGIAAGTRAFAEAIASSTLPAAVLDAAAANLSTMSSETIFRIADGSMHAFEGCGDHLNMGQGSCTHVWNYEATTPFVYPAVARSMRNASFTYGMHENGSQDFRYGFPTLPTTHKGPAIDGQCGQIVKLYQDYRISGDLAWLRTHWAACKKALSFCWAQNSWDPGARGIADGRAHNTYDINFVGANPLSQSYYIAALVATAAMASAVGDTEFAAKCSSLAKKSANWMDANLFNGEFYIQKPDASLPKQPKYQMGGGCLIDQLMGVYLLELAGLESPLDEKNVRKAIVSILRYNSRAAMQDEYNTLRCYSLEDQKAIVMCDYSHGNRPQDPFPYFSENWTGCEYAFSALMMRYGMVKEGITAYENVRARYDGEYANPFSEIEWGRHYARPMSAWSGLVMLSGFRYDGVTQRLTFAPLVPQPSFRSIWTASSGWGMIAQTGASTKLQVKEGTLQIAQLRLPSAKASTRLELAGKPLTAKQATEGSFTTLTFSEPVTITAGSQLTIG